MTVHEAIPRLQDTMEVLRIARHNIYKIPLSELSAMHMKNHETGDTSPLVLELAVIGHELTILALAACGYKQEQEKNAR